MSPGFAKLEGGLRSKVAKADVGSFYANLASQGVDLLGWADPYYVGPAIPPHVAKATVESIESGRASHYTMPIGDLELRAEVSKKLRANNGFDADPERNIIITPGSDSGLFYAISPFIQSGDEVLIPDPSYPNNFVVPELLGGIPVRVPLREEIGYQIEVEEFRKRLTPRTKMVILTQPNNPTATVFRRECLTELARFIIENDLVLVVDQAFEDHVFDDIEFVTMAALPGMWERTLSVFSLSKGMGLSGFRVGYIVADEDVMDVLYGGAVSVVGATCTASQIGAMAALREQDFIDRYRSINDARRRLVYEALGDIPGVSMQMPECGFISWVNVSSLGDSTEIADLLIRDAKVAVNDGKAYGEGGAGHLRIVHGAIADEDRMRASLERVRSTLLNLAASKGLVSRGVSGRG